MQRELNVIRQRRPIDHPPAADRLLSLRRPYQSANAYQVRADGHPVHNSPSKSFRPWKNVQAFQLNDLLDFQILESAFLHLAYKCRRYALNACRYRILRIQFRDTGIPQSFYELWSHAMDLQRCLSGFRVRARTLNWPLARRARTTPPP